jgi:hypothetical protein
MLPIDDRQFDFILDLFHCIIRKIKRSKRDLWSLSSVPFLEARMHSANYYMPLSEQYFLEGLPRPFLRFYKYLFITGNKIKARIWNSPTLPILLRTPFLSLRKSANR